jgi:hypothetical protein
MYDIYIGDLACSQLEYLLRKNANVIIASSIPMNAIHIAIATTPIYANEIPMILPIDIVIINIVFGIVV